MNDSIERIKGEFEKKFDEKYLMKNFALYDKERDIPATTNNVKLFLRASLLSISEEAIEELDRCKDCAQKMLSAPREFKNKLPPQSSANVKPRLRMLWRVCLKKTVQSGEVKIKTSMWRMRTASTPAAPKPSPPSPLSQKRRKLLVTM